MLPDKATTTTTNFENNADYNNQRIFSFPWLLVSKLVKTLDELFQMISEITN